MEVGLAKGWTLGGSCDLEVLTMKEAEAEVVFTGTQRRKVGDRGYREDGKEMTAGGRKG